jgi:hypothetical protein
MQLLVSVLGMVSLSRHVGPTRGWKGRPCKDRQALATAFLAKAILGLQTTRQLLERLAVDRTLRALYGWNSVHAIAPESTFSHALAEFSHSELPQQLHQFLIQNTYRKDTPQDQLVGPIARDSTAIEVRERFPEQTAQRAARQKKHKSIQATPTKKHKAQKQPTPKPIAKRKRGRPKKSERALSGRRLPRQRRQTLAEMLSELPRDCSIGVKTSSKGYQHHWRGYKLHIDVADGHIPISCLLTVASLHDSQVAIPLATLTAQRVTSLYAVMDAAYDAGEIRQHCQALGQVPWRLIRFTEQCRFRTARSRTVCAAITSGANCRKPHLARSHGSRPHRKSVTRFAP